MKTDLMNKTDILASQDWLALQQCEQAKDLERSGDYEGARAALTGLWSRIGERPKIETLDVETQPEVLLRVGALAGWLGSTQQIAGAQEFAKDLLSESIRIFDSLGVKSRQAEAQTDLAICYWREGALDEARILLTNAWSNSASDDSRLRVLINQSVVEISSNKAEVALEVLNSGASFQNSVNDDALLGRYHQQLGLACKRIGGDNYLDKALIEWSAASHYFEQAKHQRYQARIENNIGNLLLQLGRHFDSLVHLDKARNIFIGLKDAGSVAQVNDSRARVMIAQQRYAEAERVALAAVTTLERGGEQSLLVEALITQGVAVARKGNHLTARNVFMRAAEIGTQAGDLSSAANANLTLIEELHTDLPIENIRSAYCEADNQLGGEPGTDSMRRLRACSRLILGAYPTPADDSEENLIGGTLEQEVLHFEAQIIKRALDRSSGSITHAARQLGLTHQGLSLIIDGRQAKNLAHARNPKRVRRKSIMAKR
ncbi:MAG TPA: helix-turn-helix domain-containing protein [Pyrinomonadaceae bacterium]